MTRLIVRLTPRGGRDTLDGWDGEVLRARVAAAATEGQANNSLVRLLAKTLRVGTSRVTIVSGAHSRTKTIDIEGASAEAIRAALSD